MPPIASLATSAPSTYDAIAEVLVDAFKIEPARISPYAALESLGLDSLALMEFVFAVEDRFDVRIPEERLDPTQAGVTLGALAGLIDDAVAAKAASPAAPATPAAPAVPCPEDDAAA